MVIGLGNPGRAYEKTRHNVGFRVVDIIASQLGINFKKKWGVPYNFCQCILGRKDVILIKPRTYMNNSGSAVFSAVQRFGVEIKEIIIVIDDIWLPLGSIRIRKKGSSGGHNGLASVIELLNTEEITRCRIGIGKTDSENLVEHVLERFSNEEEEILNKVLPDAADAVKEIIEQDI